MSRLFVDLIGPMEPEEVLTSRPGDRYITGILYPHDTKVGSEFDDSMDTAGDEPSDEGAPLATTMRPSSMGLSLCLESGQAPALDVTISAGRYSDQYLAEDGTITRDANSARKGATRQWVRTHIQECLSGISVTPGWSEVPLTGEACENLFLYIQATPWGQGRLTVTLALVNRNTKGDTVAESEARTFYQTEISVAPCHGTRLVARPSRKHAVDADDRVLELIYRDTREIAVGHTCAATWDEDEQTRSVLGARTTWLPHHRVLDMSSHGDDVFEAVRGDAGPLSAQVLASASSKDLTKGLEDFVTCYESWIDVERGHIDALPKRLQAQAHEHLRVCQDGANRMRGSVARLAADDKARQAFQWAQESMLVQMQWSGMALVWRPFQLGFQLLALESIIDPTHTDRSTMDLLWFPTGGGKTEAYLGLTAFLLFYRRLRESGSKRSGGITVLMRYTLRLLTIQQFQRATALICACECLRQSDAAARKAMGDTPFSIGLWVGGAATPNKLQDAKKVEEGCTYKQLSLCPACRGSTLKWSLSGPGRVVCMNDSCVLHSLEAGLPVWTIDEDVYREQPSLLIGTVDKFAQLVRNPDTGSLFGLGPQRRLPPELIIQDELHLISGPLGSITGLYETAVDTLCHHDGLPPKVVGSTATIRRAEEQISRLFRRKSYQFPPPGIEASNSCFAVQAPGKPGRMYVGLTTAGRSPKFFVQAVAACLLQASVSIADDEARDAYHTLVGYFNTLRELGGSLVVMQDDVPTAVADYATRHGEVERNLTNPPEELTSRVKSTEIRDMLERISFPCTDEEAVNVLLASNMISVGVDIPRLGLMMVVGQPKTIAEYIQSTSRVGRKHPGLVIGLYNAQRARDRSHFESFTTWHQSLYREVEATSVTPFASRAQDKALHAALVAMVRHLVPELAENPDIAPGVRPKVDGIAEIILERVREVSPREASYVAAKLENLVADWSHAHPAKYWDDTGKIFALMASGEQMAAQKSSGKHRARALWATPNSMRDVEPATPFRLKKLEPKG